MRQRYKYYANKYYFIKNPIKMHDATMQVKVSTYKPAFGLMGPSMTAGFLIAILKLKGRSIFFGPTTQCIIGAVVRMVNSFGVSSTEELIELADGDFVLIDYYHSKHLNFNDPCVSSSPIVLLVHGLGGNSQSGYVLQQAAYLAERGIRSVGISLRGSKRGNRTATFFHAGAYNDPYFVLQTLQLRFPLAKLGICGFSIGAAISLNLLAYHDTLVSTEEKVTNLVCGATISPPIDFFGSNDVLENSPYWCYFLTVGVKMIVKDAEELLTDYERVQEHVLSVIEKKDLAEILGEPILLKGANIADKGISALIEKHNFTQVSPFPASVKKAFMAKTVREFIDQITAPLHNFRDTDDYFCKTQPMRIIKQITTPTLVIRSIDDPFLDPLDCVNTDMLKNPHFEVNLTDKGSHIGFISFGYDDTLTHPIIGRNMRESSSHSATNYPPNLFVQAIHRLQHMYHLITNVPHLYAWSELETAKYFERLFFDSNFQH